MKLLKIKFNLQPLKDINKIIFINKVCNLSHNITLNYFK